MSLVTYVASLPKMQKESKDIFFTKENNKIIVTHSDLNKYFNLITGLEILMH